MAFEVAVLLAAAAAGLMCAYLLYSRGTRLRLALDLVGEARRQLEHTRSERHALVPEYLRWATAHTEQQEHLRADVEEALAQARAAKAPQGIGPAEERLTHAVDALALGLIEDDEYRSTLGAAIDLHAQMRIIENRMVAAVRYYNLAARKYAAQRRIPTALPLRAAFPHMVPIHYQDVELMPLTAEPQP